MPLLHRNHSMVAITPHANAAATEHTASDAAAGQAPPAQRAVPATRTSVAWVIAMVAGVVVTLVVGTARITRVRRIARRRRR